MKTLITLIAATCFVGAAFGQQPSRPSKPNPDYQKMAALLGEWTYAGENRTTFLGPGGKFTCRMTGRPILDGLVREFTYEEKSPRGETQSFEINWYDPVAKNHVYVFLSNDGYIEQGPFTINGNLATWEGTCVVGGKQYKTRGTETAAPDGMSKIQKTEISVDGKMWTPWREATFAKVKAAPAASNETRPTIERSQAEGIRPPSAAQSRKVIYTKENFGTPISEHTLSLDDATDHKLTQSFRIDVGHTSDPQFDIAQEFVYEHGDLRTDNAQYSGYSTYIMRNGDRVFISWASTPVAKPTVPGEAETVGSGTILIYGGQANTRASVGGAPTVCSTKGLCKRRTSLK